MLSHSTGEAAKQVTRVMEEDIVLKLKEKITCHKNELECFYTAAAAPGSRVVSLDTWKEGLSMLLPGRSRTAERRAQLHSNFRLRVRRVRCDSFLHLVQLRRRLGRSPLHSVS